MNATYLDATYHYTVRCEFDGNELLADHWLAWLRDAHIQDVLDAGAQRATVVKIDGDATAYEIRYQFASRDAYETYLTDHAPRLRADGLKLFPPESGIRYQRSSGATVFELG